MGVLAAAKSSATITLMVVAILALMASNAAAQGSSLTCATKLIACQKFLNSSNPPEDCCKPLREAVRTDLPCLCAIFSNPEVLKSFGVDVSQALKLPVNCGITTSSSNLCNTTAVESPSGSPGLPGTPQATPGNDNNGAGGSTRSGLWVMAGLFSIWCSVFA
ncbi:lipid transfer-like protein VAS [Phalaenopsis equestris]|uniref:lipid transfer-like protein VAS n=1 Tax=Phalaenopsis equestris TaxID=78828 RepID=UPI0009E30DCD|nr:lipid transfer-like protein VAS [Phalaenopsis equestris]